ncbi:glutamate synthase [NADPH] large chain [Lachnospiraceae bacterium KM106-2]|nr:glutamate synthase [NADPH] large chain [Lachnospiraceae bacterium KM106-2]
MSKCSLVIMAAGLGSRYGGIKQLEAVGANGEIIMDYSIYAAKKAGFDKVVFIIRRDIEKDFKEVIGNRISKQIQVEYVYQDMNQLPDGYQVPEGRVKPWGTGHAVLCCKEVVREPFLVINADDYYGVEGFQKVYDYLTQPEKDNEKYHFCMVGFQLGNTLSENGSVSRGVCKVDEEEQLVDILETTGIMKQDGRLVSDLDNPLTMETPVSMNMWGFSPVMLEELEKSFPEFLDSIEEGNLKKEYFLPSVVNQLIKDGKADVKVLTSKDKWFGVTYKEDKEFVVDSIKQLIKNGVYPEKLF